MSYIKTWLVLGETSHRTNGKSQWVYRHNEFGDEPDWIGNIEMYDETKWFNTYGDNRTFSLSELKQLAEWVDNFKI